MRYKKETPRINVKFIDNDTDEILFEIKNRTWMDVGELFSDNNIDTVMKNEMKNKKLPKNIMILGITTASLE